MEGMRPIIVRAGGGIPAPPTPGMERRTLLERPGAWAGWVRTDPDVAGGWHHHGDHDSYIFVIQGTLHIDYGPGGGERISASAGDFVFNPAGMVHREVTPAGEPVEAFVMRMGSGPTIVNLEGPDPA